MPIPGPRPALALLLLGAPLSAQTPPQTNLERVVNGAVHPVARLRPDPPADRGPQLRLGLDLLRRPGHDHARRAPARVSTRSCSTWAARSRSRTASTAARPRRSRSTARATRSSSGLRAPPPSATRCGSPSTTTAASAQGHGLYFFKADGRPHRPQQVYSGGGTDGNPRWLPTWGAPADKATWELIGDRARDAHRGLQRPPGERSPGAGRPAHGHLAPGEAGLDLPHLARGGAVRRRSPTAGAASRSTTTSTARTARSPGRCSASRPT